MIPMFKTDCSIGRSILTLKDPSDASDTADSIFSIAEEHGLDRIVLVEDSLVGFLDAYFKCKKYGIKLVFGLRLEICNHLEDENPLNKHKIIIFSKNNDGCTLLNRIYSDAHAKGDGCIPMKNLREHWDEKKLKLSIPFYDSFIFNNALTFNTCVPDFSFASPTFFYENNDLPFDGHLYNLVSKYCLDNKYKMHETKSIYYKHREDFEAYQTYKIICGRGGFGRQRTLDVPNLDHMGSKEFCFDSYLERLSQ